MAEPLAGAVQVKLAAVPLAPVKAQPVGAGIRKLLPKSQLMLNCALGSTEDGAVIIPDVGATQAAITVISGQLACNAPLGLLSLTVL